MSLPANPPAPHTSLAPARAVRVSVAAANVPTRPPPPVAPKSPLPPPSHHQRAPRDITVRRPGITARIVSDLPPEARETFAAGLAHAAADHRYFDLLRDTVGGDPDRFEHLYLLLSDTTAGAGTLRSVQAIFLVREDLLTGVPKSVKPLTGALRHAFPTALMPRLLMLGCEAGEGHIAGANGPDAAWIASALASVLSAVGKSLRASMVVLKELPAKYRDLLDQPLKSAGFARVASMPGAQIEFAFKTFDEYLTTMLSKSRRADLRRKFRNAESAGKLEMSVVTDITPYIDEAYPLYRAVFERATLKFEELSREYLCRLGREMPDRVRFFMWRLNGKLVAFNLCMVHDGVIKDNYIGLDYSVALDLNLYFLSWRDIMVWALANGCQTYWTAALNYDPKLNLRLKLAPQDLYVRHVSGLLNPIFRRVMPFFGPTRYEPLLKKFPNYPDL